MARYEELRKAVVRRSNRWPESFVLPTTALQSLSAPSYLRRPKPRGESLKTRLLISLSGAVAQPGRAAEHLLAVIGYKAPTLQTRRAGVQIPPAPPSLPLLWRFNTNLRWRGVVLCGGSVLLLALKGRRARVKKRCLCRIFRLFLSASARRSSPSWRDKAPRPS